MSLMSVTLLTVLLTGGVSIRSPYETHLHQVWDVEGSFFVEHRHHPDQEVVSRAVSILWSIGDFCWHDGFHYQLMRIAKACVELDPTFSQAYETGSWLLDSYGFSKEAEALLVLYKDRNPDRYDGYYELGWFLYRKGRFQEAIPLLEKAVSFEHPPIIEHTLAHAYEKAGRPADALAVWQNKLKRFPKDPVAERQVRRLKEILQKGSRSSSQKM
ncbi:MAG: tetratricopeptide repeat protein [Armatimonadetes bacterium]|nr:tetratricopeptide repeat protein [Armatimonadota bacterium]MDW8121833.1 tetratricopeptide repeat protein [Armatimonadota bacterium]